MASHSSSVRGGPGLGITGMILGIVVMLTIVEAATTGYTEDELAGTILLSLAAVIFSGFALSGNRSGKGMAISGLVMGILGLIDTFMALV